MLVFDNESSEIISEKGGRPFGSSRSSIVEKLNQIQKATEEIAVLYQGERDKNGGCIKRGTFKQIHDDVIAKKGLCDISINQRTILSRLSRNSLRVNASRNQTIPLLHIEPFLLQISIWKQNIGQPITPSEGIKLANSLIDGKKTQERLKLFQSSIKAKPTGLVSSKFWRNFVKRNSDVLEVGKGYRVSNNRMEWVTYENVEKMYNLVYEQMVRSGVAEHLAPDEYYYVNKVGEKVDSKEESVGLQVKINVTHPEWILFGDEVGTEISQKNDGNVGGQKFVVSKGTRANIKSSHRDGRMTVIGLTAASGDPVMAIIIFAAEELTFEQRMGHDIRVPFDEDVPIRANSGPGKTFPGGPTCIFRGKVIPALITCNTKGSITSEILKHAFERLDNLDVFPRTPQLNPFALFDAHDSRLQLPFLRYINDPSHKWTFCIGLPNGTHKWQVGDSEQQNGTWKVEWVREKSKLVLFKTRMGINSDLEKSDMLPLINRIWPLSFGSVDTNKQAIRDRGWNPLNRCLLTDPEIIKTRTVGRFISSPSPESPSQPGNVMPTLAPARSEESPSCLEEAFKPPLVTPASTPKPLVDCRLSINSIDMDDVNLDHGVAGDFSVDILQHIVKRKTVHQNLNLRYQQGRVLRRKIEKTKRLTGGNMFINSHIVCDEEVMAIREGKEKEKRIQKENSINKVITEYHKRRLAYQVMLDSKKKDNEYGIAEYKTILH